LKYKVSILGAKETIWFGICAEFEIKIGNNYPKENPTIKCLNPFHHPSLMDDGQVLVKKGSPENSFSEERFSLIQRLAYPFSISPKRLKGNSFEESKFLEVKKKNVAKWTPERHFYFDDKLRKQVKTLLLCHQHSKKHSNEKITLGKCPRFVLYLICGEMGRLSF